MAVRFQVAAQFLKVVNAAVENHADASVGGKHGLLPGVG